MARRRESGIALVAALPWPVGVVIGVIAFVAVRFGIGWLMAGNPNPVAAASRQLSQESAL